MEPEKIELFSFALGEETGASHKLEKKLRLFLFWGKPGLSATEVLCKDGLNRIVSRR